MRHHNHEGDRGAVLVATVVFCILELISARPNEPPSHELPKILDLCAYVSDVQQQQNWKFHKGDSATFLAADRPAVAITLVPIASTGAAAATVFSGLLLLYTFSAAVERFAPSVAHLKELYVRSSGLLLASVCTDIATAAAGLTGKAEKALEGQLGVVERWRATMGVGYGKRREGEHRGNHRRDAETASMVNELRRVMLLFVGAAEDAEDAGSAGPEAKDAYTLAMGGVSTILQTVGIIAV